MRYWLLCIFLLLAPLSSYGAGEGYSLDDELIYRINFGRADDVKLLLGKGANPNGSSPQGGTMLTIAAARNDQEAASMVQALLDKGADPNLPDKDKNYPILIAARNGEALMVAALMAKGADFHVKTPAGVSLIEVAKQSGNADVIRSIQEALDKEAAYAASLRSPERFKEIVRQYGYHSCAYQYWNYYLSSRQNPDEDAQTQQKIAQNKATLEQLLQQIQKYYPTTRAENLQKVANDAAQEVFSALDAMVSNRYRAEKGVGKDADAQRRCQAVATAIRVTFVPPDLKE